MMSKKRFFCEGVDEATVIDAETVLAL